VCAGGERDVTFISTSDSHYKCIENKQHNAWDRETIEEMNRITEAEWPEKLGGGKIAKPRGAVWLGDCIDDGDRMLGDRKMAEEQYKFFAADVGLDGTDGVLKLPVFEGWGNHDGPPEGKEKFGFSFQAQLKKRNALRKEKGLISNVSANGLHYSWDWDDVHFVQLNIYPADKQREGVKYSPVWHDPQESLSFMKDDLAKNVGTSGRPVVLMSHCGFDTDWWVAADWKEAYDAAKAYNVILYLYGHTGTGLRDWAPEGEAKKWTCINDGNTTAGFFVIQIAGDRLRAAQRTRVSAKFTKKEDKTVEREWDGKWDWKLTLDKRFTAPAK
jgi:cytolysin (calcineurin-like family phosphatase)